MPSIHAPIILVSGLFALVAGICFFVLDLWNYYHGRPSQIVWLMGIGAWGCLSIACGATALACYFFW
jgi:hypothetical protein